MAFDDTSKLNVAFKKLVGKAQTDNTKTFANEAKFSSVSVAAGTVLGRDIPQSPSITSLYDITDSVVEYVRLELVADPSSNGHAFFARLPAGYEASSSNPNKGTAPFTNQSVLVDSFGKLQVIPPLFGLNYEAKPYIGGTSAKGSGTLIPPGDERDWYFDYFNGVFFQQDNVGGTPSYIECLVYIGSWASESGSGGSILVNLVDAESTTLPSGASATIDGVSLVNDYLVLFTNLSSDNNKIYKASGVGSSIVWTEQKLFEGFSETPSIGNEVRVRQGVAFKLAQMIFDGTDFISNDIVRFFDKDTKVNYWELSSLKSLTLTSGTTNGEVFSVTLAGSENWIINYSLVRGANKKRTGQLMLTSDGSVTSLTDTAAEIGDVGVSFNSDISGSDIRLLYTIGVGDDAEMKFFAYRWSNTAGGPASLPSYIPTGGGVPASGAIGTVQYHGSDGYLAGSNNFKWDATENAINLNGLMIGALEGPLTILDNQAIPTVLFSYSASNLICVIEYSVVRGTQARAGKMVVVTDGSLVDEMDEYVCTDTDLGITFDAILNGANIDVRYISTNTGSNASYKYFRCRWD